MRARSPIDRDQHPRGALNKEREHHLTGPAPSTDAVSSSALVPDFSAGESPISKRSNQLGDEIRGGEQRWYQVIYRDPVVLGGCPASSTFNATQAGVVTWSP